MKSEITELTKGYVYFKTSIFKIDYFKDAPLTNLYVEELATKDIGGLEGISKERFLEIYALSEEEINALCKRLLRKNQTDKK